MTNLRLYHTVLKQLKQWLPAERITRRRNMALLVTGLYLSRAVHMALIVRLWPSRSKAPSLVNRLRRFLDNPRVEVRNWYRPFARQLVESVVGGTGTQPVRLVIDCTKVGFDFRLMTIGLAYRKRTLPLVWSVHRGSRGHTTFEEQEVLLRYVRQLIPRQCEVWVMGDTGFQTVPFLQWLTRQGWHFVIRQQGRIMVRQQQGEAWRKINQFELAPGETHVIGWIRLTRIHDVGWSWLILHWEKGQDEPWYLVSDCDGEQSLIRLYKVRMWIEEMYGDMKGHGFDLEATHLDDEDRIARLVLAVCLTFVWLISLGSWVVKNGYRHLVDHKSRRDKSYFRIGWDWLARCLSVGDPVPIRFKPYP
jgi:hypothetical protein